METLSDQSAFSRRAREQDEGRYASGNLVLWLAVIAVLVGMNFASWSFCMWVFGQPEHPMNYRLLTRLDRLDPIHGFTPVSAPRGKFHSAKDLYAQVYPFSESELKAYNGILKRHYLKNYLARNDVVFLSGEFAVVSVETMGKDSVFPGGHAIRARSTTFPDGFVDFALPAEAPSKSFHLVPGQLFKIEESTTCAALLHIERREDATMVFTAVPLVERTYEFGAGASIAVKIPPKIRIEPERWPITGEDADLPVARPVGRLPGVGGAGKGGEKSPEKSAAKGAEKSAE